MVSWSRAASMDSESRCSSSATIWATASGWVMKGEPSFRICAPWALAANSKAARICWKLALGL